MPFGRKTALTSRGIGRASASVLLIISITFIVFLAGTVSDWAYDILERPVEIGSLDLNGYVKDGELCVVVSNTGKVSVSITNLIVNDKFPKKFPLTTLGPGEKKIFLLKPEDYGIDCFAKGVMYEIKVETINNGFFTAMVRG